ncbi:hypothetical protein BCR44DRAFT_1042304 [Catenaria anguillulae PL171]|uniref:Uncharacterized protein n=1 Tax=Catenaria anguillulae PL171 TaxID=765915 RepID=A0A1Y2HRM8_9FUNG|nr:hypothetical protein BCR44DRAFT_1042304 [Catenaria anguillulae PL171]
MAQHNNTSAAQGEQPPAHVDLHQAHGPLPLAFNVTHLTNPPLGYAWGPSAYLRSALSEDMWRVAVDVLVETRLLPHCNFAVASDTLVANVPGLTAVPIDPHMPRASGSGAPLVSLEFAVAVLAGFADQRSNCVAESHAPAQPTSYTNPNRLDLSKLLAIRIAHALDAVRALSAKYDHAQYARAVQHNALVSWLSRAAGQSSGLDPSPLGGAQQGHGIGGLEDVIEEDEPEEDGQDEDDADAIQVDSKLSSSSFSSHAPSCTNSAIFHTKSSETLAASMPNPSLPVASSLDRAPNIADMDDPMDCDEGGAISFSSPLPPASTVSVSASAATHSTSATPTTALSSTPTLFVAFADTGRICRATGTADVIQALVQLTDILPWVTQMRSEFGRHFVLLHVVPYAEAVAAAEANASPSVGSPVGILGQGQSQTSEPL